MRKTSLSIVLCCLIAGVALVAGATSPAAQTRESYYSLSVEGAIVSPTKSNGRHWDLDAPASNADSAVSREVRAAVGRELKKMANTAIQQAVSSTIMGVAAKAAIGFVVDANRMPDPGGELLLDGEPVLSLPMKSEVDRPSWAVLSAPLRLRVGSRIEVALHDVDIAYNDSIGTCSGVLSSEHLKAQKVVLTDCTQDALVAFVSLVPRRIQKRLGVSLVYSVLVELEPSVAWDPSGGAPDILIRLRRGTEFFDCALMKNTYWAVCTFKTPVSVKSGEEFGIQVLDADEFVSDDAGSARVVVRGGSGLVADLEMKVSGSLVRASLKLTPAVPLPLHLPFEIVRTRIGVVRAKLNRCTKASNFHGPVSARLRIEDSGQLSNVTLAGGSSTMKSCLSRVLMKLGRFPASRQPTTITYPFVFK